MKSVDYNRLILFDGVCNLCVSSVQWIIKRDKNNRFQFASLQSDFAKKQNWNQSETILYFRKGNLLQKSKAALYITLDLGFPWKLLFVFIVIPSILRDPIYDLIAKNRYRIFGRKEECWLPTDELRKRFLND